jgi:hypothetical protein
VTILQFVRVFGHYGILLIKQEMMNLRMDFGFGEDQSGFYLGFSEVF